jgi:predicted hydrolase (HD superfamily)
MPLPSRDEALALMHEYVQSESLRRHMYSVEAACRAYARRFGEDEELFGLTGLLHDFDYERFPDEHPIPGTGLLRERGYPDEMVHAILAHYAPRTGVQPESLLDRTLYACDEITGLVTAAALVRPSKSVMDLEAKSVLKKMKDKASRPAWTARKCAAPPSCWRWTWPSTAAFVIEAMRGIAGELGLKGDPATL